MRCVRLLLSAAGVSACSLQNGNIDLKALMRRVSYLSPSLYCLLARGGRAAWEENANTKSFLTAYLFLCRPTNNRKEPRAVTLEKPTWISSRRWSLWKVESSGRRGAPSSSPSLHRSSRHFPRSWQVTRLFFPRSRPFVSDDFYRLSCPFPQSSTVVTPVDTAAQVTLRNGVTRAELARWRDSLSYTVVGKAPSPSQQASPHP